MPKGLAWAGVGSPPNLGLSGDHACGWRQLGIAVRREEQRAKVMFPGEYQRLRESQGVGNPQGRQRRNGPCGKRA